MLDEFRRRIALSFVTLSSIVYLSLSIAGLLLFHNNLTTAMDNELKVMLSEFGHAINYDGSTPRFRDWIRTVQTNPARGLATIELFDSKCRTLEHFGPAGIGAFVPDKQEASAGNKVMRLRSSPLIVNGKTVGYMQVELPTTERDASTWQLLATMALISPLILIGLGASSYLVAGKAAAPLQESVEKMKSFVADAGHELNTPLSILRARLETLERKQKRMNIDTSELGLALKSMTRMEKMIEDLMLLAEFDDRTAMTDTKELDLAALTGDLFTEFEARFQEKGVEFYYKNPGPVKVLGDSSSLHRALSNLVENALRCTNQGGKVTIELKGLKGLAQMAVIDTGVGIEPEKLDKIFDRFYRSDKSRSRASGGVGLGLSIARAVALAHSGELSVTSEPGKGSRFVISLPEPGSQALRQTKRQLNYNS